jgi:endonuclease III
MNARILPVDIGAVYQILRREFGKHRVPVVDLIQVQTRDPFKVLVTTILSARTKDRTTAEASRRLYAGVKTPDDLRRMTLDQIRACIYPVGFYKNKARFLRQLPSRLDELFDGRIPDTVEELVKLPGVGRKTANLVVAIGFNKPAICVDVHVNRICNRLGYLTTKTPLETEMALRRVLPVKYWITINSFMVSFGQHLCFPVNPRCDECPIAGHCNRVGVRTTHPPRH